VSSRKKLFLCEGKIEKIFLWLLMILICLRSAIQNLSNTGKGNLELEHQLCTLQQEVQTTQQYHEEKEQNYVREKEDLLLLVNQLRKNGQLADEKAKSKIYKLEEVVETVNMQLQASQNELQANVASVSSVALSEEANAIHASQLETAHKQYKLLADKFRTSISELQDSFASVMLEKDEQINVLHAQLKRANADSRCVVYMR
jgi:hypothetical protein